MKVVTETKNNEMIDSSLIAYKQEYLDRILDKLNNSLVVYDTLANKNAEKLSTVLVGSTIQNTTIGKNLFNKNDVVLGKRIGKETMFTGYNDPDYFLSNYIEVEENTSYTKTPVFKNLYNRIAFYDADKNLISTDDGGDKATITIPEGIKYIKFGDLISNLNIEQLEKGDKATSYEPYTGGQPSPNPDYPQEIKSVTGAKKLNVVVGDETKAFELNLDDLELNGIDAYRDKIDLVDDKWIKNKVINKKVYTGDNSNIAIR